MDKRFQIFISSTYSDLINERDKVTQAVLESNNFPCGMELFPAAGIPPKDIIEEVLKNCDYYLLILAGRYGSLTNDGISYTEWEYNKALQCGLPVIAFLHNNTNSIPSGNTDEKRTLRNKLSIFRKRVQNGDHTVKYWSNADDLKAKVSSSIPRAIELQPQIGWVRGNDAANNDVQKTINNLRKEIEEYKSLYENSLKEISKLKDLVNIKPQFTIITIPGTDVSFKMIHVEKGSFLMGANKGDTNAYPDEKPAHKVTLSDFWIGETQVTQALWQVVMGENPSEFNDNPNYPVEHVSWVKCKEFIQRLNDLNLTDRKFCLPTEAQWEFAARGGNSGKDNKFLYAGSDDVDKVARFENNTEGRPFPVKSLAPNELGVYDMSGNVWEWCDDWYDNNYSNSPKEDPKGSEFGTHNVVRGGSWSDNAAGCRVSCRLINRPTFMSSNLGFRLALK